MDRRCYDIHYHLFNLSHPNLTAFLMREDLISGEKVKNLFRRIPFLLKLLPLGVAGLFPAKIAAKMRKYLTDDSGNILNLLSVMEGASQYHFLYVEHFILRDNIFFGSRNSALYNKIVICPLIIDFGYKGMKEPGCFYHFPPAKPVVNQVIDMLNAIYFYYRYDLILHPSKPDKFRLVPAVKPKEEKLFEIYPFLGINTRNYDLQSVTEMFDKYFRGYEDDDAGSRRLKLFSKSGTVKADLEDMIFRTREASESDYYTYLFAGIKLYPPLGFDPWPADDPVELEKVRFLYSECMRKKIPLTVHCSDGGFSASPSAHDLTDPAAHWGEVLSRPEYSELKVNFAHMGRNNEGGTQWQRTILNYLSGMKNIYTDCSCITPSEADYENTAGLINSENELKFLFGTDFVINLIWSHSYNDYLRNFINNPWLDSRRKDLICRINPEKFLFG